MKLYTIAVMILSPAILCGQAPVVQAVLNNATNDTHLCPGVVAKVLGNFGSKATVTVGGKPAYIFHSTATRLIVEVPTDLSAGAASLVVASGGVTSKPLTVVLDAAAPGILSLDSTGSGSGYFLHASGGPVKPSHPATRGEAILVSVTGMGATNPKVATGAVAATDAPTAAITAVTVGGRAAKVTFSGMQATRDISLVGTYRVNFTVPTDVPLGANHVVISIGGHTSNVVTLDVH